jgi:hypothetical protein
MATGAQMKLVGSESQNVGVRCAYHQPTIQS